MPYVDRSGYRLNYQVDGNPAGAPLLFSNSLGTTHELWRPQIATLSSDFRIIRYDTRGHGASGVPPGPYTLDSLGADAVAILDDAGIDRAHVCGLSLGGLTAMWLGVHRRERVRTLTLACTAARIANTMMWEERIAQVKTFGLAALADAAMGRWFTAAYRTAHPEIVDIYHRMMAGTPADGYAACCAAIRDADLRSEISSISLPTLVIAGHHDPVTPPADAEDIGSRVRGARVSLLDAAHIANVEQADAFNGLLSAFITDQRRAQG
jgi:3-oxoadipate enol-lactonase